ncbi:MRC1-like domain-containing protein [Dipodascopsis uninucleata]
MDTTGAGAVHESDNRLLSLFSGNEQSQLYNSISREGSPCAQIDDEELLTPRSRVRKLMTQLAEDNNDANGNSIKTMKKLWKINGTSISSQKRSDDEEQDAEEELESEEDDDHDQSELFPAVVLPRKRSGLAAQLQRKSQKSTSEQYKDVRSKILQQISKEDNSSDNLGEMLDKKQLNQVLPFDLSDVEAEEEEKENIRPPNNFLKVVADGVPDREPFIRQMSAELSEGLFFPEDDDSSATEKPDTGGDIGTDDSNSDSDSADDIPDIINNNKFYNDIKERRKARLEAAQRRKKAQEILEQKIHEREILENELAELGETEEKLEQRQPRKASKKALEEINRDMARIERSRNLNYQVSTKKRFTFDSLASQFDFDRPIPSSSTAADSSSPQKSTLPSSPSARSEITHEYKEDEEMEELSDFNRILLSLKKVTIPQSTSQHRQHSIPDASGSLRHILHAIPNLSKIAAKNKRLLDRKVSKVSQDNLSDSELEITGLPVKANKYQKTTNARKVLECFIAKKLRSPESTYKSPSKFLSSTVIKERKLWMQLEQKEREQAQKEKEEKIQEIIKKGGKLITAEDRLKEEELVEDILERERKNAEETRKREEKERAKLRLARNDEISFLDDEEDEYDENDEHDEGDYEDEDIAEILSDEEDEQEEEEDDDDDERVCSENLAKDTGSDEVPEFEVQRTLASINASTFSGTPSDDLGQFFTPTLHENAVSIVSNGPELIETEKAFPTEVITRATIEYHSEERTSIQDNLLKLLDPPATQYDFSKYKQQEVVTNEAAASHWSSPGSVASEEQQDVTQRCITQADTEADDTQVVSKTDSYSEKAFINGTRESFSKLLRKEKKQQRRPKEIRDIFDDQAEESEDEWAGIGGDSDNEEHSSDESAADSVVDELVNDEEDEAINEAKITELHVAHELDRDNQLVNEMMKGVHGGFRKRTTRNSLYDLSDSDDESAYTKRRLERREAKRRKKLLENKNLSTLADNPKTQAFFKTIEEDEFKGKDTQYIEVEDLQSLIYD